MRRLFFAALILISLASCAVAKSYTDGNVTIIGTEVTYNKLRKVVEAFGDVTVMGDGFNVTSTYVKYYPAVKLLVSEDQFVMEIEGYKIGGSRLEYNVVTKAGNVMIVRINFGQTFLGGSFMRMDKGEYDILNGYFTGCNKPDSDYHIAANDLVLYPETGLIVAYWSTFWMGPFPMLPIPTFVYGAPVPDTPEEKEKNKKKALRKSGKRKKYIDRDRDIFPKSGLGYNSEDGSFLALPFDWYPGPRSYVRSHLLWSEKKNLGVATAANYFLFNDRNEGEIRAGSTAGDGTFGGMTYIFGVGPSLLSKEENDMYVYDRYFPGNKYLYEFEINYSLRERVNIYKNSGPFSRVSFLPKATLRANRNNFINDNFTYFCEASWALVSEESTAVGGDRENLKADVTFAHDLWLLGRFSAKSQVSLINYMDLQGTGEAGYEYWNTATQTISLRQDWGKFFETGIGHNHIYFNNGGTPFEFESYWFSPYDTLSLHAQIKNVFFSSLSYDGTYDLPSQDWRRISYSLTLGMHCYDIEASYDLVRDAAGNRTTEFTVSGSLSPSKW